MSNEDLNSVLHGDEHLKCELFLDSSSLKLNSVVSLGLVHHSHVLHLEVELSLEVLSHADELAVSSSHDNSDLSEVDLGGSSTSLHEVHSTSGSEPSDSPLSHVCLEALDGSLGVNHGDVDLSHPLLLEDHLSVELGLLGTSNGSSPLSLGFLESVDTEVVGLDGGLEDSLGVDPVGLGSLHKGFHLVSLGSSKEHRGTHLVVGDLSVLSDGNLVVVVLVGNSDLDLPLSNELDGTSKSVFSSALGLEGDSKELGISDHLAVGLVLGSDSDVSLTSGSISLGFPESGKLLSLNLGDLLVVSFSLHVGPDLGGVDGSLDSSDSGNLGSDVVHLGLGSESLLVDHDLVSSLLSLDLGDEHLSRVFDGGLPFLVLGSSLGLSSEFGVVSLMGKGDLDVSLLDGLLGSSHSDVSSGVGNLGLLDFTELSGVLSLGLTGSNTSEVGISVGSLLSSNGKTDSGSLLGFSNTSVLDRELELEVGNVSELLLSLESEESSHSLLLGGLEVTLSDSLEVGSVSHSVFSMSSLLSSLLETSNNGGSSSKLSLVGFHVLSLVISSRGVDLAELSSLGADESSLVEAVSVHPVRSTDDSDTSSVSTSLGIGLSLTPVLVLEGLTVNPSVTLGGLAGTDPVSLDVRLDHVSDLPLLLGGEDRDELTAPFAADTSGVVPGLLLLEYFEVSDDLVSNGLKVSSSSGSLSSFLGLDGSNSSLRLGESSGSSLGSFLLLLGLDLGSSVLGSLSLLDLSMSSLSSGSISSSLLLS